jgi:hypothetical protein
MMTVDDRCFVEWKEQFVSQERGHRIVHYYFKDSAGESFLAVIGTERSVRHMCYVIAEEFLEICGLEIPPGFKWRSRREVVDWLTSMLSKQHLQEDRNGKLIFCSSNLIRCCHYIIVLVIVVLSIAENNRLFKFFYTIYLTTFYTK